MLPGICEQQWKIKRINGIMSPCVIIAQYVHCCSLVSG
jgi:hypothetical protein